VHSNEYAVQVLCRVLGVSRSAYYSWQAQQAGIAAGEKKKEMEQHIISVFREHRRRYGVRRVAAELKAAGKTKAGVYQVRKVMKAHGLKAIQPRSFVPKTTDSRHPYPISPNLLLERPLPCRPDEVWVGDITYIPLAGGRYGYLSVWMDLYSRKIIGWHLEDNMKEELIIAAFKKALMNRRVTKELLIHSDRGGQYAGNKFRKLIHSKPQVLQSMSRADNPYDNAFMESCFSRFKTELLQDGAFENLQDAHTEIFEYIEMYYNTKRRHSALNYASPMNYEKNYYSKYGSVQDLASKRECK
jgi:putative transposase